MYICNYNCELFGININNYFRLYLQTSVVLKDMILHIVGVN